MDESIGARLVDLGTGLTVLGLGLMVLAASAGVAGMVVSYIVGLIRRRGR